MSPIPLGFWATAGASAGAAPAYELIETVYPNGSTTSVTFSSIPQTYKHLELRMVIRGNSATGTVYTKFNGVSSAVYASHILQGYGSGIVAGNYINQDTGIRQEVSTYGVTSAFSPAIVNITNYANANVNKTIRTFGGTKDANVANILYASGLIRDTAAISTFTIDYSGVAFTSGSRFSLYGIKG